MKKKIFNKFVSYLSIFSILATNFYPLASLAPKVQAVAYSESTDGPLTYSQDSGMLTINSGDFVDTELEYEVDYLTSSAVGQSISGRKNDALDNISVLLGSASTGSTVPHSISHGIAKVFFVSAERTASYYFVVVSGEITFMSLEESSVSSSYVLGLDSAEQAWLNDPYTAGGISFGDSASGKVYVRPLSNTEVPVGGQLNLGYNLVARDLSVFQLELSISYSDDPEDPRYLDEEKFSSLFYFRDGLWADYQLDSPASTVTIDKDANIINASLWHLTPIVPVIDPEFVQVPELISPVDNSFVTGSVLTNSWTSVSTAEHYIYESYHNEEATNVRWTQQVNSPLTSKTAIDVADTTFWWRVKAVDTFGNESEWSPLWKVTVDNTTPTLPSNLRYQEGESDLACNSLTNSYSITAKWDASTDTNFSHYEYRSYNPTTGWVWNGGNIGNVLSRNGAFTVGDGTYGFAIQAVDKSGNVSGWTSADISSSCQITYDSISPTKPNFTNPVNNSYTNVNAITLNWEGGDDSGSGVLGYSFRYVFYPAAGGSPINWGTGWINTTNKTRSGSFGHGQGVYEFYVKVKDVAGNISAESEPLFVTYDATAPVVDILAPMDSLILGAVNIRGSVTDANPWRYYSVVKNSAGTVVAGPGTVYDSTSFTDKLLFTWNTLLSPDGVYTIHLAARDKAQNRTAVSEDNVVVTVDNTKPSTPEITSPMPEQYFNTTPILNSWTTASDSSGIKEYHVEYIYDDGHTFSGGPYRTVTTTSRNHVPALWEQGGVTIRVRAVDNVGNIGEWSNPIHYTYDATAPTATISYDIETLTNSDVKATLHPSEVVVITNNGGSDTYTFSNNGDFTFNFVDQAGNPGSATAAVDWIDKTAPVVTLAESPVDGLLTNESTQIFGATTDEPVSACTLNFHGDYAERSIDSTISGGSEMSYFISGDDYASMYTLPFNFPFYGNLYSNVSISTNGLLRFGAGADSSLSDSVANLAARIAISPLWDDIVTNVYTQASASELRLRWTGYGWATGGTLTAETVLRPTGNIEFHYGNVNLPSRAPTIGISAGDSTNYVISSVSGNSTINNLSFAYSPAPSASYAMSMVEGDNQNWNYEAVDLPDGIYTYSVSCLDLATNEGQSDSRSMTIDTMAPVLGSQTTFEGWYSEDQTSFFTYEDENGIDEETGNPISCIISTEGEDQTCSIDIVNICDRAGNCNTNPVSSNGANIDKYAPTISHTTSPTIADGDNGWFKTQPEITLTAFDVNLDLVEYKWGEDGAWQAYSLPFKPSAEGIYQLYYRALDKSGKYSEEGKVEIKWDQTDPSKSPQNISVSPNPTNLDKSTVKWEAAEDLMGIDHYEILWSLDGTTHNANVGPDIRSYEMDKLTEGVWNVTVRAYDGAGNNKSASVDLTVDKTAPSAPTLVLGAVTTGQVSLSWAKVAGANSYSLWYGTESGNYLYAAIVGDVDSYTVTGLGAGDYFFAVKSHDSAGNVSGYSNEVASGTIAGTPGVAPGTPGEGFAPAEDILGDEDTLESSDGDNAPSEEELGQGEGDILGDTEDGDGLLGHLKKWWWLWLLILLILYRIYRHYQKKVRE